MERPVYSAHIRRRSNHVDDRCCSLGENEPVKLIGHTVLLVVLAVASCRDAGNRTDSGVPAGAGGGGSMGSGAATGSGGDPIGSGGVTTGGAAGVTAGGAAGTVIDGAGGAAGGSEIDAGPATTDASAEAGRVLEPIRVSGGSPDAGSGYNDVRFVGLGLEQWEGAVVTLRIGSSSGFWRLGSGQV